MQTVSCRVQVAPNKLQATKSTSPIDDKQEPPYPFPCIEDWDKPIPVPINSCWVDGEWKGISSNCGKLY